MATTAGVAVIAKQKHIVDAFRRARATAPGSGVVPTSIGISEGLAFRKLREHAVLREASPGCFYLDEPSWQALRATRLRIALVGVLVVLIIAVLALLRSR